MKLTHEQELMLRELADIDLDYRHFKANGRATILQKVEAEVDALRVDADEAIYDAIELGVPKSRVAEACGTTSYRYVQDAYDRHVERITK